VLVSGYAALARGDPEQAIAMVSGLAAAQQQAGVQSFTLDVGHIQARAYLMLNRLDEAESVLASLRARAERQKALRMLWAIQALQADVADRRGRLAEASALRESASAIVRTMAAFFTDPKLRDAFLSQPDVQTLLAKVQSGQTTP
jgi:hypothetical protein